MAKKKSKEKQWPQNSGASLLCPHRCFRDSFYIRFFLICRRSTVSIVICLPFTRHSLTTAVTSGFYLIALVNGSCDPSGDLIGFPSVKGRCVWIASTMIGVYVHIRLLLPSFCFRYICILSSSSLNACMLYLNTLELLHGARRTTPAHLDLRSTNPPIWMLGNR